MKPIPFRGTTAIALAVAVLLAGCAAQQAFRDAQALLREGKTQEAIPQLQKAQDLEPGSAEYRMALAQARQRVLAARLQDAEALRRQGNLPEAERAFRAVLAEQGGSEAALAGLRQIDRQRRAAQWLQEAQAALAVKDAEGARVKLRAILLETPGHEAATRLLAQLEEAASRKPAEAGLSDAYRNRITIEFKDAPLKSVFEVLSRSSGLNFLLDRDVRGDQKTSIFLRNSTVEAAVNLTLLTNQLAQKVIDGNTVLIYPNTVAKQRDYQNLAVRTFYLSNAEAKAVAATLTTLLKTRDVVVDEKLNMVIVRDSPEAIKVAEKLVALQDQPDPEVMMEVEILEVKRTRLMDLGVRWPDSVSLSPLAATQGGAITVDALRNINSASIGATISPLTITARKTDSDANILANPRIRARNREKARILIGERVPNITSTITSSGFVSESINYVDVGLKLEVEPTVYLDGDVAIKINMEVSNIISQVASKSGTVAYQIGTRTAQTVLRLKDGENQVLAGLINDEDRRTGNKVPGLGEIPVVGRLFGQQVDDGTKTEIVLSITPRVLRNIRRPEASLIEFDAGTETNLSPRAGATPGGPPRALPLPGAAPVTVAPGLAAVVPAPGPASTATLAWTVPQNLRAGDSFDVPLRLQADGGVSNIPVAVGFDARVLQVTSIAEGDFMRQGGVPTVFNSRVDPSGQAVISINRNAPAGATGSGTLATLSFRVLEVPSAETRLQVLSLAPTGPGGSRIIATLPNPQVIRVEGVSGAR